MQYGSGSIENGKNNSVKILETVGDDRHSSNTFMLIDTIRTHQSILNQSTSIPFNPPNIKGSQRALSNAHSEAYPDAHSPQRGLGYSTATTKML